MKQKQMRDERLSALLTEAYDAHLDAALSCHCEPVTDVTGVAIRPLFRKGHRPRRPAVPHSACHSEERSDEESI